MMKNQNDFYCKSKIASNLLRNSRLISRALNKIEKLQRCEISGNSERIWHHICEIYMKEMPKKNREKVIFEAKLDEIAPVWPAP